VYEITVMVDVTHKKRLTAM